MKTNVRPLPFIVAYARRPVAVPRLFRSPAGAASWSHLNRVSRPRSADSRDVEAGAAVVPLIYAVDDLPGITELYRAVLTAKGYSVRTFNDRVVALSALQADPGRPGLLITDYLGLTIPVNRFILACRALHPGLRVLMVSGLERADMRLSSGRPDRFLQKPFTPVELQQQVEAALAQ